MAIPSRDVKTKVYYHGTYDKKGTNSIKLAKSIANDGIIPPKPPKKEDILTPLHGMSYVTPHLGYALTYALGGLDIAGHPYCKVDHSHGYVFVTKGDKLHDIQPDEDSVGEIFHKHQKSGIGPEFVTQLAKQYSDDYTIKRAKEGDYDHWAKLGKQIIPHMTDEQKLDLIHNYGAHVANKGPIIPDRVYRISTNKIPHLKPDGSNFFDHAEELDMDELRNGNVVVRRKRKPL